MNGKKWCAMLCAVPENHKNQDLALLILRLVVGAAFIYHGYSKVSAMDGAIQMFASMGVGTVLTYIAAYTEFLGGIAIFLGVATRLAGGLLTVFMASAIYLVHLSKGYGMMNGGYEYQLLLLVCVLYFALVGPGKYSVHASYCPKH